MGVRGRRSSNQLSTRAIHAVQRPDPPERLSGLEAEIWRTTVGALAADWFPRETLDLLECYCTHVVRKRDLAERIRRAKDFSEIRSLSALEREQTHLILLLASKMRLTQRSSRVETRNKHKGVDQTADPATSKKPWDRDDGEEAA